MKKALSVFLAIAVLICSSVITFASNSVNAREPDLELAYLDYDSATPEMKEKILAARNQIIFSTSWVADGYSASIGNVKTGEIIRVLPSFSELFPGWDIPVLAVPDVADNALPDESQSIMNPIIDPIDPDDWVGLTTTYYYLPAATNVPTNPFFSSYIDSCTMGRVVRTYEEQQLMALYHSTGTRAGLIAELTQMRGYLGDEDSDLRALTDSAIGKLEAMTDEDCAALDLTPDFGAEDEDAE